MKTILISFLAVLLVSTGCGRRGSLLLEDTAPFAAALERHLSERSMGMMIVEFESLAIAGDKATGIVRMADKEVGYGLQPRWTVTFSKESGGWKVADTKY